MRPWWALACLPLPVVLWRRGRLGAGDAKLFIAIGGLLGAWGLVVELAVLAFAYRGTRPVVRLGPGVLLAVWFVIISR